MLSNWNNEKEWKGPYCIVKKLSNATYKVDIDGKEKIVHIDNIKTCIENKANDIVHVSKTNDDIEHVDKRLIEISETWIIIMNQS